jgi:hypothetical protein
MLWFSSSEARAMENRLLRAIAESEARIISAIKGGNTAMTAGITKFQADMTALFATESTALDGIKAEEEGLKQQISDLQAKQAAGTFGPDDQAALDSIEAQYSALGRKAWWIRARRARSQVKGGGTGRGAETPLPAMGTLGSAHCRGREPRRGILKNPTMRIFLGLAETPTRAGAMTFPSSFS